MVENQLMLSYVLNGEALNALLEVPRHLFDSPKHKNLPNSDSAIPLTRIQAISQTYIVALMNQIAKLEKMVLPFAESFLSQNLFIFPKKKNRALNEKFITGIRFLPFTVGV